MYDVSKKKREGIRKKKHYLITGKRFVFRNCNKNEALVFLIIALK
jgi:hypothetical protein